MQVPKRKPAKFSNIQTDPFITKRKFEELKKELEHLKDTVRPKLVSEVSRLAELGDFSENAEYQLAKAKLRGVNNAIFRIETELKNSQIIEVENSGVVQLGNFVTLRSRKSEKKFQILGSAETSPEKGIISHNSPLGSALIGKEVGETVVIKTGNKEISWTIIKIE